MLLEICVDSVESAIAAQRGGAQRVELCSDLLEGGITPSPGLLEMVRRLVEIEVFAMVRPRAGDFFYTNHELKVMKADIQHARRLGADGIVLGVLDADGYVDVPRTRELVELAAPLPVTFHRGVDVSADRIDSLERIVASGARRVLTSGGKRRVIEALSTVAEMIERAAGRITVMTGGGLNAENIRAVAEATGATEFHASLTTQLPSPVRYRSDSLFLGANMDRDHSRFVVREEDVRRLRDQLDLIESERTVTAEISLEESPD